MPVWDQIHWRDELTASYECSPWTPTAMFRYRVGDRFFQLHAAIGARASDAALVRLSSFLSSLAVVESQPAQGAG